MNIKKREEEIVKKLREIRLNEDKIYVLMRNSMHDEM